MSLDLTGAQPTLILDAAEPCSNCQRPATDFAELKNGRLLLCVKCKTAGIETGYCSRDCQLIHFKTHKPFCGRSSLYTAPSTTTSTLASSPPSLGSSTFSPPQALALHTACLSSLPTPNSISYLYYPTSPLSSSPPPDPIPITLPRPTRSLFTLLLRTANSTGNQLSVNLMYSIMLSDAEEQGVEEGRLVQQLGEEYGFDLRRALEEEEEPSEEELEQAIGGKGGMGTLLAWQMSEAERLRD